MPACVYFEYLKLNRCETIGARGCMCVCVWCVNTCVCLPVMYLCVCVCIDIIALRTVLFGVTIARV
jgi:hypothetical protein